MSPDNFDILIFVRKIKTRGATINIIDLFLLSSLQCRHELHMLKYRKPKMTRFPRDPPF